MGRPFTPYSKEQQTGRKAPVKGKKRKKISSYSDKTISFDSEGNRWTAIQVKRKTDAAKREFLEEFKEEHGHHFCQHCRDEFVGLDIEPQPGCEHLEVSHIKSVAWAKKNRQVELSWTKSNFQLLGNRHHAIFDKNY